MRNSHIISRLTRIKTFPIALIFIWLAPQLAAATDAPTQVCGELLAGDQANLLRRNALLRLAANSKYQTWLYDAPDVAGSAHAIAIISEPRRSAQADAEVADVVAELTEFDQSHVQNQRLSMTGNYAIIDTQGAGRTKSARLLDVLEGIARLTPFAVLLASPWLFGKNGQDLILSPEFLITNFGVMFLSWKLFPDAMTHVSKADLKAYQEHGVVSPGILKRHAGSVFERTQREEILKGVLSQLTTFLGQAPERPGKPIFAFVLTPDIAELFAAMLLRQGYTSATTESTLPLPP